MKTIILLIAAALVPASVSAKAAPKWQDFAACAAAYRVNAAISDPNRSTSMKAQISETGDDYETAAIARYKAASKADDGKARAAVQAYAASRMPALRKQKREELEKFIDACPQTEE